MPKDKRDQDDLEPRRDIPSNREPREDLADEPWARLDAWGNIIPNVPFMERMLAEQQKREGKGN